jgi:pyruvate dehydrogenase E2 component (dihydrolipoyllysine-residue acetyltransferase)
MPTDVVMPQMGESVAEGTIVRWLKQVGDSVDKDEPLFEISTDKVDAEIPSPNAGVLLTIRVNEGETVPVNTVVAEIGSKHEQDATGERSDGSGTTVPLTSTDDATGSSSTALPDAPATPRRHVEPAGPIVPGIIQRRRTRSSPLVRRIARDHSIDISRLTGTGVSGRVTRRDIQAFVDRGAATPRASGPPAFVPGENVRIEKMSIMRKKIAEHMAMSVRTSPHVYSAFEVDFSRVDELRKKKKAAYEAAGTKLTYTAFVAKATIEALRECPFANAAVDGDNVVYKNDINLGFAVALEQGLIVPVIHSADRLSMLELSRRLQDLAERARTKQLKVDDVQGGTFTITNPGVFGALFGLPIINQPQVAILGVGSVDKRAVVVDDAIVIRPMCYLTLGHDHRLIDGAEGARFLEALKRRLEGFDEAVL